MITLKEFNKNFGQMFPLAVVKSAYDKVQSGAIVGPALSAAVDEYADKLAKLPLNYTGFTLSKKGDKLVSYYIKTTTKRGLCLAGTYNDIIPHELAIAKLGENFECDVDATYAQQPNSVIGGYSHRNCYVSVVKLNFGNVQLTAGMQKKLQNLADVLAKNALAWYPAHSKALNKEKYYKEHKMNYKPVSGWKTFFLAQVLRFVPNVNDGYESGSQWYKETKSVTIGDYLAHFCKENKIKLDIQYIHVSGL